MRGFAIFVFIGFAIALFVSYRSQGGFLRRSRGGRLEGKLSGRLVSSSEGFHRFDLHGDKARFLLSAARDDVFDDGHHEMRNVTLEVYGAIGITQGEVRASSAIYDPGTSMVVFEQGVEASTSDGLSLKTERLEYDGKTQVIRTDSPVEFARRGIRGYAVGAEIASRRGEERVSLLDQVRVIMEPKAESAAAARSQPVNARCGRAEYRQNDSIIHFFREVILSQSGEELSAEAMEAHFDQGQRLRRLMAHGSATLISRQDGRVSEVRSTEMEFLLDEYQRLVSAVASGGARASRRDAEQQGEVKAERIEVLFSSQAQNVTQVLPARVKGQGDRVEVRLSGHEGKLPIGAGRFGSPGGGPSEKVLTANTVELSYRENARELEAAHARGGAVLALTPLIINRASDRKTIRADSMELQFYEGGNFARTFHASSGVRVEFEPMTPEGGRAARTATSDELSGEIGRQSQEFTELAQWGHFKYVEGERSALSERAVYTSATQIIKLTGGEPVAWDSHSRTRAKEIELNNDTQESRASGNVVTTYYSRKAAEQSLPFSDREAPIFLAADRLNINHRSALGIYGGNARAWQEDDYVSADRIELHRQGRMMMAVGRVRSGLYRAPRSREAGATEPRPASPVFASGDRLTYFDDDRFLRYEGNAQTWRESQRIAADVITVFLQRDQAEIERAVSEGRVVVTEPERRAYGDSALYTAATQAVVLRGRPARVEDDRNGVTRGPQLTFNLGDDKVTAYDERGSRPVKTTRKIQ